MVERLDDNGRLFGEVDRILAENKKERQDYQVKLPRLVVPSLISEIEGCAKGRDGSEPVGPEDIMQVLSGRLRQAIGSLTGPERVEVGFNSREIRALGERLVVGKAQLDKVGSDVPKLRKMVIPGAGFYVLYCAFIEAGGQEIPELREKAEEVVKRSPVRPTFFEFGIN